MERRRLQKWKRVEELRHQDYLIAGGKMESKRREIVSDKIFEYRRDDIDRIYPEICDNCCEMKDDPNIEEYNSCEEIWHDIPLDKLNYEYIYDCVIRHNLIKEEDGFDLDYFNLKNEKKNDQQENINRLYLETKINKWRRAPELEQERLEELDRKKKERYTLEAGTVYAFGKNDKAQLGLGDDFVDKEFVRWPTAVPHMKDKGVSQVYCGYDASVGVAVNEDGRRRWMRGRACEQSYARYVGPDYSSGRACVVCVQEGERGGGGRLALW